MTSVRPPFDSVNPSDVESIELDLARGLKELWLTIDEDKLGYLEPLIGLETIYPDETLKIFTLNYDLKIELTCKKLGVGCTDGFRDGSLSMNAVPVFRDAGKDLFSESPVQVLYRKGDEPAANPRVELFKLHGSVNWF